MISKVKFKFKLIVLFIIYSLMLNPASNLKEQNEIAEEAVDFIDQFYTC